MIDGQRRRTLTGHWLTTMVLEEVGRVFSALRCTHRLLSLLANGHPNVVTCSLEGSGGGSEALPAPQLPCKGGSGLWPLGWSKLSTTQISGSGVHGRKTTRL